MPLGHGTDNQAQGKPVKLSRSPPPLPVNPVSSTDLMQVGGSAISEGQTTMSASLPVVVASDQSALPNNLTKVSGSAITLGQTTKSASLPVTIASDQGNTTVVGTGTFAVQAAQSGNWSTRTEDGSGNAITSTASALDVNLKSNSIDIPVIPATDSFVSGTANTTGATSTLVITAVASKRIYCTSYSVSNSSNAALVVSFQDGSGGTTLWQVEVPATGEVHLSSSLPVFRTTAGNGLYFQSSGATTVYCNASGFSQ